MNDAAREALHTRLMQVFCEQVTAEGRPLVLKGGTALKLCYGLPRFSETLDFDLTAPIKTHINVESLCKQTAATLSRQGEHITLSDFRETKKTATTHRCRAAFLGVGKDEASLPLYLKIEISSRATPAEDALTERSGIGVYTLDELARLKLLAATAAPDMPYRTAARDLHDLIFILLHHRDALCAERLEALVAFLADPVALAERYEAAYEEDSILGGKLFDDLAGLERWLRNGVGDVLKWL